MSPLSQELRTSSAAFYIEADKTQASALLVVEAQEAPSSQELRNSLAPFYIEAHKTQALVPFAVEAWGILFSQGLLPSSVLSAIEAWEVPLSRKLLASFVPLDIETDKAQALAWVFLCPNHRPMSHQWKPHPYAEDV